MIYLCFRLYRFNKAAQSKDSSIISLHQSQMNPLYKLIQIVQLNHCDHLQRLTLKHCIICQKRKTSDDTHKVKTMRKGIRVLQVAKEIEDKGFFIRLDTIPNPEDAFADDVIYYQSCWIYKQREASKDKKTFDENHNDKGKVKSDIEIINTVKSELIYPTA